MRVKEIKENKETVIRTDYIASDDTIFNSEEECEKYENSALFVLSNKLKELRLDKNRQLYQSYINEEFSDDSTIEIYDIKTVDDLIILGRYLYLTALKNGASEEYIESAFYDEKRKDYTFHNVTTGHEVIIFWSYDKDYFWVYRDGSIQGFLDYHKDKMTKLIYPNN